MSRVLVPLTLPLVLLLWAAAATSDSAARVAAIAAAAVMAGIMVVVGRLGVDLSERGAEVRTWTSTRHVPLDQIAGFSLPQGAWQARLQLRDGSLIAIPGLRPSRAKRSEVHKSAASGKVDELNAALERLRRRD